MEDTGIPSFRIPSLPHGSLMVHGFAGQLAEQTGDEECGRRRCLSGTHRRLPTRTSGTRDAEHRDRRRSRSDLGLGGSINTAHSP
ncbi:hypothetical protein CGCSCA4_v013847 [Colletotrichum siamense]|uniref:Uncharacterized protein n=1 Tax=Colletotrichum siamense TaxID=690259 RepID=A0A9P5BPW5_COLSI|nr:hypothetical protein CGCSCA4_v013847 [Colletotrichum siamense]KAF4847615.1 hypothetical protein CGCSCA2_v012759 [Colletotrichum siamense]